jgi:hypothetical protein
MRAAFLAALCLAAACAAPKPCTLALCVSKLDGTMDLSGWSGSVRAASDSPKPSVVNETEVRMVYGKAEFMNGKTKVSADEGSVFTFRVSTRAIPSIELSTGSVTIQLSSGAPVALVPGAPYYLPKAK